MRSSLSFQPTPFFPSHSSKKHTKNPANRALSIPERPLSRPFDGRRPSTSAQPFSADPQARISPKTATNPYFGTGHGTSGGEKDPVAPSGTKLCQPRSTHAVQTSAADVAADQDRLRRPAFSSNRVTSVKISCFLHLPRRVAS
jgi:hypothetical protein